MSGNKRNSCLSDIIETRKKRNAVAVANQPGGQTESKNLKYSRKNQISKWFLSNVWRIGPQVWFQNARAKFRRNLLRQDNTGVDKASDGSTLPGGTPSGPASEISNASMSPSSTPTTLTDLTNPTMPTVTSVLTSVPGQPGHSRMPESIAEHLNQPLLILRLHSTFICFLHLWSHLNQK